MAGPEVDSLAAGRPASMRVTMTSLRSGLVTLAAIVTVFVVVGMLMEQDKVASCMKLRQDVPPADEMTAEQRQMSIIVKALTDLKPAPANHSTEEQPRRGSSKWDYNWDMKQWSSKEEAFGVHSRTLLLIRHGQYDYSTGSLTEKGREEVDYTGARLKELGMRYSHIVHSPMLRARETAHILHSHLQDLRLYEDALLEEGGPVPPEPTVSYWSLPKRDYFVNGPRMESAFRKYFHRADKSQAEPSFEIIVGHGNLFRFFSLRALQLPPEAWMRTFIAHASITQLNINPDGTVSMTRFGDSGHMPPDHVTY